MLRRGAALAAMLVLVASPALAAPGCNIQSITGAWALQVTQESWDEYFNPDNHDVDLGFCWLVVTRNSATVGNARIFCPELTNVFALGEEHDGPPWHQVVKVSSAPSVTIDGRRFATPERCEWKLTDRNYLDADYTIYVNGSSLAGGGRGYLDRHYGHTEPKIVTFTGVRQ